MPYCCPTTAAAAAAAAELPLIDSPAPLHSAFGKNTSVRGAWARGSGNIRPVTHALMQGQLPDYIFT